MSDRLAGKLLVASPMLADPNFFRTVVLVCEHTDEGALGVVLNRQSGADVGEFLPAWTEHLVEPGVVFVGGPVQREVAVGVARVGLAEPAEGWTPVLGDMGLLDLGGSPLDVPDLKGLRVFSGYAGWGPGQLDAEVADDDWFVVAAEPDDPFRDDPATLWRRVLRRQRGNLRLYADFPPHPSLN